jgi:hypothetical protein
MTNPDLFINELTLWAQETISRESKLTRAFLQQLIYHMYKKLEWDVKNSHQTKEQNPLYSTVL